MTYETSTDDQAKNNGTILALAELREAVESMHKQTAELAARLDPILRDTEPTTMDDSVVAVYHGSYTTQEVRRAIDLVRIVRADIANIVLRIDL